MNPLVYDLCKQTVTIYRKSGQEIVRKVAENCYFSCQSSCSTHDYGKSRDKQFLLIIPGNIPLGAGDRIFAGIGPNEVQWQNFLPCTVPEVFQVSFARPCFFDGELTHWEAGHKKEAL